MIISEDCYKYWLTTRRKKLIHPQESFRRVLTSHIRGVYGRKPFYPHVEQSLLKVLRRTDSNNKPVNAWKRCFPEATVDIGKPKFESQGYHEAKNIAKMNQISTISLEARSNQTLILATTNQFDSRRFEAQNKTMTLRSLMNYPCDDAPLLRDYQRVLSTFYTPEEIESLDEASRQKGVQFISPALMFFLQGQHVSSNPMYDTDLLLPPLADCSFYSDRPVGSYSFDYKTWIVKGTDANCRQILQRDLTGLHAFEFVESPLETLVGFTKYWPLLRSNGSVWTRLRMLNGSGEKAGFLVFIVLKNSLVSLVQLQEQSERYGELLFKPLLI